LHDGCLSPGDSEIASSFTAGKIHFFAMDRPHSDACFVQAYPGQTAKAFCDGHNAAFKFFGKVPRSILYDNTTGGSAHLRRWGAPENAGLQRAAVAPARRRL
jgi:transposase